MNQDETERLRRLAEQDRFEAMARDGAFSSSEPLHKARPVWLYPGDEIQPIGTLRECPACCGHGFVVRYQVIYTSIPPRMTCPECHGAGYLGVARPVHMPQRRNGLRRFLQEHHRLVVAVLIGVVAIVAFTPSLHGFPALMLMIAILLLARWLKD